ncbi:MAG: YifB family Mg chelatase-like AAA ATPase, partial [Acetobacteraceae bacterium]
LNAEVDPDQLAMAPEARRLVEEAAERLGFSARGYTRVIRVARTIADLADAERIERIHVAEALRFRHRIPGRGMPGVPPARQ